MTPSNLVSRKILLSGIVSKESFERCIYLLNDNSGIQSVDYHNAGNYIAIEYDQLLTNYSSLLAILSNLDIPYTKGLGFKFRTGWYDYLDNNTRENALAPPAACCNKPPKKQG